MIVDSGVVYEGEISATLSPSFRKAGIALSRGIPSFSFSAAVLSMVSLLQAAKTIASDKATMDPVGALPLQDDIPIELVILEARRADGIQFCIFV
jgi:hypothetical protein